MSDESVFSNVRVQGRMGSVTFTDEEIAFEGKSAIGTSRSVWSLEAIKEDVMKPVNATVDLKLELEGFQDILSFQMSSLSECVRFRRVLEEKVMQFRAKTGQTDATTPAIEPRSPTSSSRPNQDKRGLDANLMADMSERTSTSRPGVVRVDGPCQDAGTAKARRTSARRTSRASVSLPLQAMPAAAEPGSRLRDSDPSPTEPSTLVPRRPDGRVPDVVGDSTDDDISEFADDMVDQSEHRGSVVSMGASAMSQSRGAHSRRRLAPVTQVSIDHQGNLNGSVHSSSSNSRAANDAAALKRNLTDPGASAAVARAQRRPTARGLRNSESGSETRPGAIPSDDASASSRVSSRSRARRENQKSLRQSSTPKQEAKQDDPVKDLERDLEAAVQMKEDSLFKMPSKIVEKSTEFSLGEEGRNSSVSKSMRGFIEAFGGTVVEARVVEESSGEFKNVAAVASAVNVEEEENQRKRTLYRFGGACCLAMIVVIVLAVLAATDVIGGGKNTTVYTEVPVLTPEERFALIQEKIANVVYDITTLEDKSSPQHKALQWLATEDTFHSEIVEIDVTLQEKLEQRYTLAVFYYAMAQAGRWRHCSPPETGEVPACIHPVLESYANEGVYYDQKMSEPAFRWLSSTDECSWAGMKCTDGMHVSHLQLAGYKLKGALPVELGFLKSLVVLDLQQNSLVGSLPAEWGVFESENVVLQSIRLDRNQLTGSIPDEWCQFNSASLKNFVLSNNKLTGTIPSCLSEFGEMENFSVMSNSLTGTIPTDLGILLHLNSFHVGDNHLVGKMPDSLCNLKRYEMKETSADCKNEESEYFVECECCTTCCDGDGDGCSLSNAVGNP